MKMNPSITSPRSPLCPMLSTTSPKKQIPSRKTAIQLICLLAVMCLAMTGVSHGESADSKPIKVFILSGQSNMVGAGKVAGGEGRFGSEFVDLEAIVYKGDKPIKTQKLAKLGNPDTDPYPGGTRVVRGNIQVKETGSYELRPGYSGSSVNIMEVDGKEVHRREHGKESVYTEVQLTKGKKTPFKITYLTKHANGVGWIRRMDVPGALTPFVKRQGKYPYLLDGKGQWAARDDVWYKGVVTAKGDWPLGVKSGSIGPELGFGHVVGEKMDEQVLILKASQGNRSLGWDFLPPGSKSYEYNGKIYAGYKQSPESWDKGTEPKPIGWYAGKQYDECFTAAHKVLDNFDKQFPQWKGRGYEIAGFVWWQGDKDRYNTAHASRYEVNLVYLINSLRKEFKAPKAPFVVATLGQTAKNSVVKDGAKNADALNNEKLILDAQLAVDGTAGKYPEFKGNVATVYTHPLSQGGASNSHYNGNSQTYMDVGEAMGKAMVKLLDTAAKK
jgi:hypothetical protein